MDNNNVDENYKKFQQYLCQYLSKPIKDFASVKPQILKILQTHRPIRVGDYKYGISKAGKKKCQLIVHEFNDRSMVREYFKSGKNVWHCCECNRTAAASDDSPLINDLVIEHGIVFVKSEHECKPRQRSFVLKVQKLYNESKFDEANSLQNSVLGSEDSNVFLKQNKVAARKTSRCLNGTKEADVDISLQRAQENDKDVQGHRPSFMDEDVIPEAMPPEDAFKEIIENLKEYTNEKAEVVLLKKSKILSLLKANRPVKMDDYFYGLSLTCKPNERLIVFEFNDRKGVREYAKRNDNSVNLWRCRECYKLWSQHRRFGKEEHNCSSLHCFCNIVFVQIKHDCLPRSYRLVMQMQNYLAKREEKNARRMARTVDFTCDDVIFANTVLNVTCTVSPENMNSAEKIKEVCDSNTKPLTNLKRKIQSANEIDAIYADDKPPLRKKSKLNKSALKDTVEDENGTAVRNKEISVHKISKRKKNKVGCEEEERVVPKNDDDNSSLINDESLNSNKKLKRKKNKKNFSEEEDDSFVHQKFEADVEMEEKQIPTTFAFAKPSPSALEEICTKLNIQYRNQVTKLWDKIIFEQIDTLSIPTDIQTHNFKTENCCEFNIHFIQITIKNKYINTIIMEIQTI